MQVYASHEVMVMVMEECLPCLFKSLCSYVFISLSFSHDVGIMLCSCWKWKIMGCSYEKQRKFMRLWSCFISLSHVMLRKWKNKWRLCVGSLNWEWKKKRTMRSNRRETWGSWNLPPWISTSWWVLVFLLKYEVFKSSLFIMLSMGNLA